MHRHSNARTHPPVTLKVSFSCDLSEVRSAVAAARDFLAKEGWDAEDLMSVDLALVEACNNAVQYCRGKKRALPLMLEVDFDGCDAEFRLHDHTPGFDWQKKIELPSPDSEHGRGLYLIHALMTHVEYVRGRNANMLVMRRCIEA
jgi:anti-sigma regulatory factor (Ser/Thr protein kinase)